MKRSLLCLCVISALSACSAGMPRSDPTPSCSFDQDVLTRIEAAPVTLPPTPSGSQLDLELNRIDSKQAYEALRTDARALASESRVCLKSQGQTAAPSKLDQRLQRIERRIK